ncbi:acyl-CoA carboxylase subunit epsilon [Streptomyces hirsutus]|uniref:acyl-CoA carboxylase subunit epsilon n=1 Tax=Streptomyces hirsutus TaxID=35620 RepID=UPI0036B67717
MIKVVRGNPTREELAAVVSVLSVARAPVFPSVPPRPTGWGSRRLLLRTPHAYGMTGWLTPVLPC